MLNKIKNRFNNKKGFTLVELIVVIVIILILAAVLVPNVTKYVGNARTASLKSDASAILTQVQADYTAFVSGSGIDSGITANDSDATKPKEETVNGVKVTFTNGTVSKPAKGEATAKYDGSEITGFAYTNKSDQTITWTQTGGWS